MTMHKVFRIIQVLSIGGIVLAIYLLWQQIAHPDFQPCNINSFINCEAVISGPVAKTFGIPTPLFGLIGYIVIFLSATFKKTTTLFLMASFGLLFCLWIGYKELFQLHVICPICITCQLIMIAIFILTLAILARIRKNDNGNKKN